MALLGCAFRVSSAAPCLLLLFRPQFSIKFCSFFGKVLPALGGKHTFASCFDVRSSKKCPWALPFRRKSAILDLQFARGSLRDPLQKSQLPFWGYLSHLKICKIHWKNVYFLLMASLGKLRLALFALFAHILNDFFTSSDCFGLICVKKCRLPSISSPACPDFVPCLPSVSSPARPRFRPLAVADLALHVFFRKPATVSRAKIEGRRCALPRGPSMN